VFRAKSSRFKGDEKQTVAVKVLKNENPSELQEMVEKELQCIYGLTHENIVDMHGICFKMVSGGEGLPRQRRLCFVMELMEGTLDDLLYREEQKDSGPRKSVSNSPSLSAAAVEDVSTRRSRSTHSTSFDSLSADVKGASSKKKKLKKIDMATELSMNTPVLHVAVRSIVAGMRFLHDKNICHRDLKPANVLCSRSKGLTKGRTAWKFKLADFGSSMQVKELVLTEYFVLEYPHSLNILYWSILLTGYFVLEYPY
jgi:serine/threonine protein kinase